MEGPSPVGGQYRYICYLKISTSFKLRDTESLDGLQYPRLKDSKPRDKTNSSVRVVSTTLIPIQDTSQHDSLLLEAVCQRIIHINQLIINYN
jgi:hypothetical protein